jgi:uncharacterized protein YsxB (DUF464 family)
MIKVVIKRDSAGSIKSFSVDGHAGYAQKGADIICSAVSVTAYTAAGALQELAGFTDCYSEADGHMTVTVPSSITKHQASIAEIVMETTAIGFKQIELSYGKYVVVVEEEV